jgi:flavin reductase (DIM6/NTAB) family NADH-FMN oxidoreductase RutF
VTRPYSIFAFEPSAELSSHQLDNVERRNFRNALGHYPTGITVVTALTDNGTRIGLTVNSFTSVSLHPPLILFAVALRAASAPVFQRGVRFAVNLLAAHQTDLAQNFARSHPDKFAGIDCVDGQGGVPLLPDCSGWLECLVHDVHPSGDHLLIVGRVDRFGHYEEAEPLLYHRGQYKVFGATR